jgi:MFS family permease
MLAYIILFNHFAVTAETEIQRVFWIRSIMAITSIIPVTMVVLAHTFPEREITLNKYFIFAGACFSVALSLLSYTEQIISHYSHRDIIAPFIPGISTILYGIYFAASMITAVLILFKKYKHSTGMARMQIRYFILGIFLVWGLTLVANVMFVVVLKTLDFTLYAPSLSFLLVGLLTYSILRHRFLDIRMVAMRSIVYVVVGLLLSIAYALTLFTVRLFLFNIPINLYNLFTSTILALIMAYSFHPLSRFFKSVTDKYFYKNGYDSNKLLRVLGRIMSSTYVLADLTDLILHQIMQTLKISSGYIVLTKDAKITWHKVNGDKTIQLKDSEIDYLIQAAHMKKTENVLVFEEMEEEKLSRRGRRKAM